MRFAIQFSGEDGIRTRGGELTPHRFSKPALSAAQPPLQIAVFPEFLAFSGNWQYSLYYPFSTETMKVIKLPPPDCGQRRIRHLTFCIGGSILSDSTQKPRHRKAANRPKKPDPEFPLTPHASGAWQKKIRGRIHYFGKWAKRVNGKKVRIEGDGWKGALELYKSQADDLHAGRTPRAKTDGLTVTEVCSHFWTAKQQLEAVPKIFSAFRIVPLTGQVPRTGRECQVPRAKCVHWKVAAIRRLLNFLWLMI